MQNAERKIRRSLIPATIIIVLTITGFMAFIHPANLEATQSWTVSLDANSTGPTDANPQSTNTVAKAFTIGAIIDASSTKPVNGVYGWQFSIVYDNTTLVPQGNPTLGAANDAAQNTANFGAQAVTGNPNWDGLVTSGSAFGGTKLVAVDATHQKISVFYSLLAPHVPVNIGPVESATVKGNLLANVAFEIVKKPTTPISLSITDAEVVDNGAHILPNINPGSPVTMTITNDAPVASFTSTALASGDSSCMPVTGGTCSAFAVRLDGYASSDGDGTIATPVGYFWDFGDGSQDNVNQATAGCPPPTLLCNQGLVAIHDYGFKGTFNATLRVVDNQGATGSARDPLGNVIVNHQPSHAAIVVGGPPPKPIPPGHNFSVNLDANSVSQTDVALDSSASQSKSFRIGAVINASSASPLTGVWGWHFTITYNASAFVPQGDPTAFGYPDGAGPALLFGSQGEPGTVNWAGLIDAHQAFGNYRVLANYPDGLGRVVVSFGLLDPRPPLTISAKTLLANVKFELLSRPSIPQSFSLEKDHYGLGFVDYSEYPIPGVTVIAGLPVLETVTDAPPHARFTVTPAQNLGAFAFTFNATGSSDSDGSIPSPGGYFWDFGDGTQDLGVTGPVVTHSYGVLGKEQVTLRVQDNLGATGSARDSLGNVLIDNQPSHTSRTLGDLPPVASFSTSYPYGGFATTAIVFDASKSFDPDGTIVSYSWNFGDGVTSSIGNPSHGYSIAGAYNVTLVVTDDSGSTGKTIQTITVKPYPKVALFFRANDADDYENGVGEVDVRVNGHLLVNVPGGLYHLNGTGEVAEFTETWIEFGPFDVTDFVVPGTNTIVFSDPLSSHVSWIGRVSMLSANATFLDYSPPIGKVNATQSVTLRFSNPPLHLSTFTVSPVPVFNTEDRTFTATYTGGAGPFKCTFRFGDGGRVIVNSTTQSCSTVHAYWIGNSTTTWWNSGGNFTATVWVQGTTLGEPVVGALEVNDLVQPGLTPGGLTWSVNNSTRVVTFRANITNQANIDLLVRIDFIVRTPSGGTIIFTSPSFVLVGGQTRSVSFTFTATGGPSKYCFVGTPTYGIDSDRDGLLQDSEVLGTRHTETGCFTIG